MYDGIDMTKVMFGQNAVHVPCWMYVQDQGDGAVSFVGGSRGSGAHPLRFGFELVALVAADNRFGQHYLVRSGRWHVDADGACPEPVLLERWERLEGLRSPRIVEAAAAEAHPGTPRSWGVSNRIASYLVTALA